MIKLALKDYRTWCLLLALGALLAMLIKPVQQQKQAVFNLIFIVDITRSMNAADYRLDGKGISRLEYVKHSLRKLLLKLSCQSRIGLGIFTERRSALLFEPVEVCSAYAEIDAAITQLNWRMAWAADSRIANGLLNTLEMLQDRQSAVVFITDGQEAPPVNPRYKSDFSAIKGKLKGMIIGAGGLTPVPIPKFKASGEADGFYKEDDVPHRSTFGQSNLNPEEIEGYNARNAPFGSAKAAGTEHLTSLRETYLQTLAAEAGLGYSRLGALETLRPADLAQLTEEKMVTADIRWWYGLLGLQMLIIYYLSYPGLLGRDKIRSTLQFLKNN